MSSLRDSMPGTAAAIDDLRAVFGEEMVNAQIRKSMKGMSTFYAEENVNGKVERFGVKSKLMKEITGQFYVSLPKGRA